MGRQIGFLFCLGLLCGWFAASAVAAPARDSLRVHDPSTPVRCGEEFWVFSTGTGLLSRHSRDLTNWQSGPVVFPVVPGWVPEIYPQHNGHFWAPDVLQLDGRYLLYYSVSRWGQNNSVIALATNATLDPMNPSFRWRDQGVVIQSKTTNNYNAIDPALLLDQEGRLWLSFGSFWSGIKLVELDRRTGHRLKGAPLHSLAVSDAIEAPFLCFHEGYYYLFVNWGQCCRGVNSTYNIRVGRSRAVTGPYHDKSGRELLQGGGTLFTETVGDRIGPGHAGLVRHAGREWFTFHYYDATRRGLPVLGVVPLEWDAEGWPRLGSSRGK